MKKYYTHVAIFYEFFFFNVGAGRTYPNDELRRAIKKSLLDWEPEII
jgi:hypothetical protein